MSAPSVQPKAEPLAKMGERQILQILRELRTASPEARRLILDVSRAIDDLRAFDELRRIP